jgi:hypothetical protein
LEINPPDEMRKKGALSIYRIVRKLCLESMRNKGLPPLEKHKNPVKPGKSSEKIQEKPRTFDRYILRYFAILQCEF